MSNFRVLTLQSLRVTTTIGSRRLLPESKNRGYGDDAFTILFVIIIVAMLISFAYLIYRMVNREVHMLLNPESCHSAIRAQPSARTKR
jgi:uncharacterized membrane protein